MRAPTRPRQARVVRAERDQPALPPVQPISRPTTRTRRRSSATARRTAASRTRRRRPRRTARRRAGPPWVVKTDPEAFNGTFCALGGGGWQLTVAPTPAAGAWPRTRRAAARRPPPRLSSAIADIQTAEWSSFEAEKFATLPLRGAPIVAPYGQPRYFKVNVSDARTTLLLQLLYDAETPLSGVVADPLRCPTCFSSAGTPPAAARLYASHGACPSLALHHHGDWAHFPTPRLKGKAADGSGLPRLSALPSDIYHNQLLIEGPTPGPYYLAVASGPAARAPTLEVAALTVCEYGLHAVGRNFSGVCAPCEAGESGLDQGEVAAADPPVWWDRPASPTASPRGGPRRGARRARAAPTRTRRARRTARRARRAASSRSRGKPTACRARWGRSPKAGWWRRARRAPPRSTSRSAARRAASRARTTRRRCCRRARGSSSASASRATSRCRRRRGPSASPARRRRCAAAGCSGRLRSRGFRS